MADPFPGKVLTKCDCELCVYGRNVKAIIESRDVDKLIELVNELMNNSVAMAEDLEYRSLILDGAWHSSVKILERKLEHARAMVAAGKAVP